MSISLLAMQKALENTGLYKMDEHTRLYAELRAYDAGLQLLHDGYSELEQEAFVFTANSYGLSERESLYGLENSVCTIQQRKEMLLLRGAIDINCFYTEALQKALLSDGIEAQFTESASEQTLDVHVVSVKGSRTETEITDAISNFLPAHLEYTITFAG